MASTGKIDGTYVTTRQPAKRYTYVARYDSTGFVASVTGDDGTLAGQPTIGWPASLESSEQRAAQCRNWVEESIEDQVGVG